VLASLVAFAEICRRHGIGIGPGELLDATRALGEVGLAHGGDVRAALTTTLCRRGSLRARFDELYDLYFLRREEHPLAELLRAAGLSEDDLAALLAAVADRLAFLTPDAASLLGIGRGSGRADEALRSIAVGASPLHGAWIAERILGEIGLRAAEKEALGFAAGLPISAAAGKALGELVRRRAAAVIAEVHRRVEEELSRARWGEVVRPIGDGRPLHALDEAALLALRDEVRELARRLRTQRPLQRTRRGRLDVPRTLRAAAATGGVPFRLHRRRRRRERPEIVLLCDVSDSVRHVARFLLTLAHTLAASDAKVRSFVFVAGVAEVSALFASADVVRAADVALSGTLVDVHAHSDYGVALARFCERHAAAVTRRTTLVVLGDARTNYRPPRVDLLLSLRRRARRVLWLTPEAPGASAFGDSVLHEYAPACDQVWPVHDLGSLRRAIRRLAAP
jgi:uncharacterized protein